MLSTAASCSLFAEEEEQAALASQAFSQGSLGGSARGSVSGCDTVRPAVRMALARLGLDEAPVSSAPVNAFFPQAAQPSVFSLPPSEPYIAELHRCWPDSRALSHHTSDSRGLATMANADSYGLGSCYGGCRKGAALSKQRLSHWVVDMVLNAYRAQGLPMPLAVKCHSTDRKSVV